MKTNSLDFDAQALREKILDLAMRGKLVKQDPNDEPASVLLEKIKAEKAELVKEGKIKKSKALPEITDEEKPFDIPDSWEWVRLGDIGAWAAGATPSRKHPEYYGGTIPWLKTGDLNDGIVNETSEKITELGVKNSSVKVNEPGNVLIAMYGATIGKLGIVGNQELVTNQACCGCSLFDGVHNWYLFYYLLASRKRLIDLGSGGAQPNISKNKIEKFTFPLPPLEEQSRIAAKIAQLFALLRKVESSTQQYAKLQTLLKSKVLDLAMRGKLVEQDPNDEPASVLLEKIKAEKEQLIKEKKIKKSKPLPPIADDEKPFEIPDSWEWVRLGEILALEKGSIRRGPFGSSLKKAYFVPKSHNTYKVYEQGNAINHTIDYGSYYISAQKYDELKSFAIRPGDIIISGAGTIGKTYILPPESPEGVINQALIRMRLNNKLITNDFFLLLFKQKVSLLNKKAKGTAIKNMFSIAHMKEDIVWALPPISEQNRIVKQLQEISKMM